MKYKEIPVFQDHIPVGMMYEYRPMVTRVYEKYKQFFKIAKIYHIRGKKVIIEVNKK